MEREAAHQADVVAQLEERLQAEREEAARAGIAAAAAAAQQLSQLRVEHERLQAERQQLHEQHMCAAGRADRLEAELAAAQQQLAAGRQELAAARQEAGDRSAALATQLAEQRGIASVIKDLRLQVLELKYDVSAMEASSGQLAAVLRRYGVEVDLLQHQQQLGATRSAAQEAARGAAPSVPPGAASPCGDAAARAPPVASPASASRSGVPSDAAWLATHVAAVKAITSGLAVQLCAMASAVEAWQPLPGESPLRGESEGLPVSRRLPRSAPLSPDSSVVSVSGGARHEGDGSASNAASAHEIDENDDTPSAPVVDVEALAVILHQLLMASQQEQQAPEAKAAARTHPPTAGQQQHHQHDGDKRQHEAADCDGSTASQDGCFADDGTSDSASVARSAALAIAAAFPAPTASRQRVVRDLSDGSVDGASGYVSAVRSGESSYAGSRRLGAGDDDSAAADEREGVCGEAAGRQAMAVLESEGQRLQAQAEALQGVVRQLRSELQAACADKEVALQQLVSQAQQLQAAQSHRAELATQVQELSGMVDYYELEREAMHKLLEEQEHQLAALVERLAVAEQEVDDRGEQLAVLREEAAEQHWRNAGAGCSAAAASLAAATAPAPRPPLAIAVDAAVQVDLFSAPLLIEDEAASVMGAAIAVAPPPGGLDDSDSDEGGASSHEAAALFGATQQQQQQLMVLGTAITTPTSLPPAPAPAARGIDIGVQCSVQMAVVGVSAVAATAAASAQCDLQAPSPPPARAHAKAQTEAEHQPVPHDGVLQGETLPDAGQWLQLYDALVPYSIQSPRHSAAAAAAQQQQQHGAPDHLGAPASQPLHGALQLSDRAALLAAAVKQMSFLVEQKRKVSKVLKKLSEAGGPVAQLEALRKEKDSLLRKYTAAQLAQQQMQRALGVLSAENRELSGMLHERRGAARQAALHAPLPAETDARGADPLPAAHPPAVPVAGPASGSDNAFLSRSRALSLDGAASSSAASRAAAGSALARTQLSANAANAGSSPADASQISAAAAGVLQGLGAPAAAPAQKRQQTSWPGQQSQAAAAFRSAEQQQHAAHQNVARWLAEHVVESIYSPLKEVAAAAAAAPQQPAAAALAAARPSAVAAPVAGVPTQSVPPSAAVPQPWPMPPQQQLAAFSSAVSGSTAAGLGSGGPHYNQRSSYSSLMYEGEEAYRRPSAAAPIGMARAQVVQFSSSQTVVTAPPPVVTTHHAVPAASAAPPAHQPEQRTTHRPLFTDAAAFAPSLPLPPSHQLAARVRIPTTCTAVAEATAPVVSVQQHLVATATPPPQLFAPSSGPQEHIRALSGGKRTASAAAPTAPPLRQQQPSPPLPAVAAATPAAQLSSRMGPSPDYQRVMDMLATFSGEFDAAMPRYDVTPPTDARAAAAAAAVAGRQASAADSPSAGAGHFHEGAWGSELSAGAGAAAAADKVDVAEVTSQLAVVSAKVAAVPAAAVTAHLAQQQQQDRSWGALSTDRRYQKRLAQYLTADATPMSSLLSVRGGGGSDDGSSLWDAADDDARLARDGASMRP